VWGTGTPRREFLFADDLADACVFLMEKDYAGPLLNVGTGEDITIRELAETVCQVVGFEGELVFDNSKPDGTLRKLLCVYPIKRLGWQSQIGLSIGVRTSADDFIKNFVN
jgi:GDP-L-fucose synthase